MITVNLLSRAEWARLAQKRACNRRWYAAHLEQQRARNRESYEKDADRRRERTSKWRESHPVAHREALRSWRDANPDKVQRWRKDNREARLAYNREWYAARREQQRFANWLRKYGVTPERLNELLAVQGGVCPICLEPLDMSARGGAAVAIDHDHATGVVRGILHCKCNIGIGQLGDDPEACRRAAEYLLRVHS